MAAHDLINVQDTGKSIPDFIMDKSAQTQQLSTDTDQSVAADDTVDHFLYMYSIVRLCLPVWDK